jgi:hypothetical protein
MRPFYTRATQPNTACSGRRPVIGVPPLMPSALGRRRRSSVISKRTLRAQDNLRRSKQPR